MIGLYVHHHGRGHLHRARALADRLAARGEPTTVLSSLEAPADWPGAWVTLPYDVGPDPHDAPQDPTAAGTLHWAPLDHPGLRTRMTRISTWLDLARPRAVVCDVSQEVALLCRLHGVPVVSVVQPGRRDDPAHLLGLRAATGLVAVWPPSAGDLLPGVPTDVTARVVAVGGLSRFPAAPRGPRHDGPLRVVVLGGRGGDAWSGEQLDRLRSAVPDVELTALGPGETWVADPWPLLRTADAVVTHAGQNAVAEVAAARVPAVVVPAARPFDEQQVMAARLDDGPWPAVALASLEHPDWRGLLDHVAALDGEAWAPWCDGDAADRLVDAVLGAGVLV
ncbi:glycosyltransferase [Nocardioides marmoraquaticus]